MRRAIWFVSQHHSYQSHQIPSQLRRSVDMTWFCRYCQKNNSEKTEHCRFCEAHWTKVWMPSKRRSRSKSVKASYKDGETKEQPREESKDWEIFPAHAPWIPTTPSARSMNKKADPQDGPGAKEPSAQMVKQPATSMVEEDVLSPEEEKILAHLQGLREVMQLPEEMQVQYDQLQAKQKNVVVNKELTHSHINKLGKLRNQVTAAGNRVKNLDQEWAKFVEQTMSKVRQHAQLYQKCRSDLLESFNLKSQELANLKIEVSKASQSMLGETWTAPQIAITPNSEEAVELLQQTIDLEGYVKEVDLTEDMEEEDLEEVQKGDQKQRVLSRAAKPFRAATSPTKVANQYLKAKATDGKTKDKEDKA